MNPPLPSFELRAASQSDGRDIYDMLQSIGPGENGFGNTAYGLGFDSFPLYLRRLEQDARGENLGEGRVPQTTYWFLRDAYPLGLIKLRHYLNDALRIQGGHIGYCIRPNERGKGYGTLMLKEVLNEAKKRKLLRVLLTCHEANTASRQVIERNGGILEKIEPSNDFCYYWIVTPGLR